LRPRHRTTLCSQSVKFRRAPYGPDTQRHSRHRTVLQQPGPRPHIISNLQSLLQSTTIYRTGQFRRSVTVVLFHPTHHSWEKDGYPTHLDRLTYFQTHGELHKGPCTFSLPGTNNLPRHLRTPAATSYLRFIMDAQRPRLHFVQLNGSCQTRCQRVEVTKD